MRFLLFKLQICSLDETGVLILWSVIVKTDNKHQSKCLSLIQNSKVILSEINQNLKDIQCTDMTINLLDFNHIFISTNYGYVLHYLMSGTKPIPKKYMPGKTHLI